MPGVGFQAGCSFCWCILGLYRDHENWELLYIYIITGAIYGLCRDNGKEHGNYFHGL